MLSETSLLLPRHTLSPSPLFAPHSLQIPTLFLYGLPHYHPLKNFVAFPLFFLYVWEDMDLQLGLALPIHDPPKGSEPNDQEASYKKWVNSKRCHGEAFGECFSQNSQLLLAWSGQPNEDDDPSARHSKFSCSINKFRYSEGADDDNQVVGWPPIKSWRKKLMHGQRPLHQDGFENVHEAQKGNGPARNMFVKVKMEGVAIVRKINLRTYQSYNSLKGALIAMFSRYNRDDFKDHASYTITYQDKEGDWLLAGDIPWLNFVESVHRLEIQRSRD